MLKVRTIIEKYFYQIICIIFALKNFLCILFYVIMAFTKELQKELLMDVAYSKTMVHVFL